jgi:galactokinase
LPVGSTRHYSSSVPFSHGAVSDPDLSTRLAAALFNDAFGAAPVIAASAPGRFNLIGEHTDYNGGPVLPVALERRTSVVAGPADRWEMVSAVDGEVHHVRIDGALPREWTGYLAGVVRELRAIGAAPGGARIAVASNVPIGAGLSSSAALTVAGGRALSDLAGRRLDAATLVDVASRAEHEQVGVRGGRMDQTIAVYGRKGTALLFETGSGHLTMIFFHKDRELEEAVSIQDSIFLPHVRAWLF